MTSEISIIVPVYNSIRTLERCLGSLISQTMNDISIILVDDGSTDGSSEICDKYSLIDNRINVIHKKNEGVSSARNVGLLHCKTKYLMFVDSDDFVEPTICEKLYKSAVSNDVHMSCCGFSIDFYKNDKLYSSHMLIPKSKAIFEFADFKSQFAYLYESFIINSVCCKLYNLELINRANLKFPNDISVGEDLIFNLEYLRHSYAMSFVSEPLYHYRNVSDSNSLTHKFDEKKIYYLDIEFYKTKEFCHDMKLDQFMYLVSMIYLKGCLLIIEQFIKSTNKEKRLSQFVKKILKSPNMSEVLSYKCKKSLEYFIYKCCFKTKSVLVIVLLVYIRIIIKKILRGS